VGDPQADPDTEVGEVIKSVCGHDSCSKVRRRFPSVATNYCLGTTELVAAVASTLAFARILALTTVVAALASAMSSAGVLAFTVMLASVSCLRVSFCSCSMCGRSC